MATDKDVFIEGVDHDKKAVVEKDVSIYWLFQVLWKNFLLTKLEIKKYQMMQNELNGKRRW